MMDGDSQRTMLLPPDWRPGADAEDALYTFLHHLDAGGPLLTDADDPDPEARYVIGGVIGAGSASQVLDAYDRRLRRHVALKILHIDPGVDRERIARFVGEAQVTAQLDHLAIPPVYEIARLPGGMPYFAMRLVPGRTLDDWMALLRTGAAAPGLATAGERLEWFLRVCDGVAHAHGRNVVHRDLKPANLMVAPDGDVNIMDWGLAKIVGEPHHRHDSVATLSSSSGALATLDGAIAGTPAYMAPEQAWGRVDRVGPRADVYALGLILAELLTLWRVRREATRAETLAAVRTARPVRLADYADVPDLPPGVAEEIRRATDPDPEARHADAGVLAQALRRRLEDARRRRRAVWPWLAAGVVLGFLARALLAGLH